MEKEQQQTAQSAGLIYGLNDRPPFLHRVSLHLSSAVA